MTRQARSWGWVCAALSVPGLLFALIEWPTQRIFVTFTLITMLVAVALILRRSANADPTASDPVDDSWPTVTTSALAALTTLSLAATLEVSPALALLMALAIATSSPWARAWTRRLRRTAPAVAPAEPSLKTTADNRGHADVVEDLKVDTLSNAELCTAWRTSYTALQRAGTATGRATVVANRQRYLDEMELRNPTALTAWLASGARAASGPDRYLRDGPNPHR